MGEELRSQQPTSQERPPQAASDPAQGPREGSPTAPDQERDYFISYTAVDLPWAEWIAVTLEGAGYTTTFQHWDFLPGGNFVHLMHRATQACRRTIAVLSPAYLESSQFGEAEWSEAFTRDPLGEHRALIPVRIAPCEPDGLHRNRIRIDLIGVDEPTAKKRLLDGVAFDKRPRPDHASFPGAPLGRMGPDEPPSEVVGFPATSRTPQPEASASRASGSGPPPGEPPVLGGPPTERTPWEWLSRRRPSIEAAGGVKKPHHVGHDRLREELRSSLTAADTAALVMLTGTAGSGKTSLMAWIEDLAGQRVANAGSVWGDMDRPLDGDGKDLDRLWRDLHPIVAAASDNPVLLFDNVDRALRERGITRLIHEAITKADVGLIVLSMSTPLTPQLFSLPVSQFGLYPRQASVEEFDRYLDTILDSVDCPHGAFSAGLRRSLFDLSEQTSDFRAVHYVLEQLLARFNWKGEILYPSALRRLLQDDPGACQRQLPAVRAQRGTHLAFRQKDKSELLAELLHRHFQGPTQLADIASVELDGFNADAFLSEAQQSFLSAIMNLCFTFSPSDLVLLLPRQAVREEMRALRLDANELLDDATEEAELLVRGLGFTLTHPPAGLREIKEAVEQARGLVNSEAPRADKLKGTTATVLKHVEAALLDLLSFWSSYLFGSIDELIRVAELPRGGPHGIDLRRLTRRTTVELIATLNEVSSSDVSAYRLHFTDPPTPISPDLLQACHDFADAADLFDRIEWSGASTAPGSEPASHCRLLVEAATNVLRASVDTFPSVIKLSEIVFDEYSRKVFRGVDSEDKEVRFAFTDEIEREDLIVARHYFLLPRKRVIVNPQIVARGGRTTRVHFHRADAYDASSSTQRQQSFRLLEVADLHPKHEVIDIGCGTGVFTLELARRVAAVHGIDHSPEMIEKAERRARNEASTNVTFELADLLEYETTRQFDVAISNSTMHWIMPERPAYSQLFALVRRGGRIAVHQGGKGSYEGLHEYTKRLLQDMKLGEFYQGWTYPVYYPTRQELEDLLLTIGFEDVDVKSVQSDGAEYPDLVHDFSEAGLLPYLNQLPDVRREMVRSRWVADAAHSGIDLYTNRLYATAVRP